MTSAVSRDLNVLYAEDNAGDARLAEETLKDSMYNVNLSVVEDGELAMAYLRKEGDNSGVTRPDLMLLDLKLPGMSGEEVLAAMNSDADLTTIPVIIVTGTTAESSLMSSYNIPPSRVFQKPLSASRFDTVVTQLSALGRQPIRVPVPGAGEREEKKRRWWWPFG